jgi:hypothetical protein
VRTQLKWLSEVSLTSNLPAAEAVRVSAMPNPFLLTFYAGALTGPDAWTHGGATHAGPAPG